MGLKYVVPVAIIWAVATISQSRHYSIADTDESFDSPNFGLEARTTGIGFRIATQRNATQRNNLYLISFLILSSDQS